MEKLKKIVLEGTCDIHTCEKHYGCYEKLARVITEDEIKRINPIKQTILKEIWKSLRK